MYFLKGIVRKISFIFLFLLGGLFVTSSAYASLLSIEAHDEASMHGEAIGNTGYNYIMKSAVEYGRHINSIYVVSDQDNWVEIGWERSPNEPTYTFWAYKDGPGNYHSDRFESVMGGTNMHFKIAVDTATKKWHWIINGASKKNLSLSFVKGYPVGGSEKNSPGESNYAHWWNLQVKRSQGDYRDWLDLREHLDPDMTRDTEYYFKKISNTELYILRKNMGGASSVDEPLPLNVLPSANFNYSPSAPTDLDTIQFNDHSTDTDGNIAAWEWQFGDGATSNAQNPTHRYTDNGRYNAKLRVQDNDGAWSSFFDVFIDVANVGPNANAGSDLTTNEGSPITISAASSDPDGYITSYLWNFGDGASGIDVTPTHAYADNGTYPVNLTVTDNDGASGGDQALVTVNNVAPTSNAGDDQSAYWGDDISFNGSATDPGADTLTYKWDFGDGSNSSSQNTTHAYVHPGTYTATLTVTDDDGGVDQDSSAVIIKKRPSSTKTSNVATDYSDIADLSATLLSDLSNPLSDRIINFLINGDDVGMGTTNLNGVATASPIISLGEGSYLIDTVFDGDSHYLSSNAKANLTVDKEEASLLYAGQVISRYGLTVNLNANITEENDGSAGDITKAAPIEFELINYFGGKQSTNAATSEVAPGYGATATTISDLPTDTYQVFAKLVPNSYYRSLDNESMLVIYNPDGGFVTGGGFLTNNGSKANFGFNVKYKTDETLQGEFIMSDKNNGNLIQIRSIYFDWLVLRNANSASFFGKAVVIGQGVYDLRVDVSDSNSSTTPDSIKVSLSNGYSASGNLSGGNITIHQASK